MGFRAGGDPGTGTVGVRAGRAQGFPYERRSEPDQRPCGGRPEPVNGHSASNGATDEAVPMRMIVPGADRSDNLVMKARTLTRRRESRSRSGPEAASPPSRGRSRWNVPTWFGIGVLLVAVTVIAYLPALDNQFTNWDDTGYVTENYLIRDLSGHGLQRIFSANVEGNYHPLTVLSLALDFRSHRLDPAGYHATAVALHVLNTLLAFVMVVMLTNSTAVGALAALLFGVHPMHVESVAWIAARKDLLYTLFLLASCIAYIACLRAPKGRWAAYGLSLALFVPALLSKGMAVCLPLVFLLIDLHVRRKWKASVLVEKIPFFLLALGFGVVAIVFQQQRGAVQPLDVHPFPERVLFAFYGVSSYLVRFIVPLDLSAFYPYPSPATGPPPYFFLAPVLVAAIAYAVYRLRRRLPLLLFGTLFFLVTVVSVLQLYPVGNAIIADRYTYLPYVGLGIAMGELVRRRVAGSALAQGLQRWMVVAALVFWGAALVTVTRARCDVWTDSLSLWNDVIARHPQVAVAYNNRALAYKNRGEMDRALADLTRALTLNPGDPDALANRANWYFQQGKYDSARVDLDRALARQEDAVTFNSRGAVSFNQGRYAEAVADFNQAIALSPDFPEAYLNRANALSLQRRFAPARADYDTYLRYDPGHGRAHFWRGLVRDSLGDLAGAVGDYSRAVELEPGLSDAYLARARVRAARGDREEAIVDARRAQSLGLAAATPFLEHLLPEPAR